MNDHDGGELAARLRVLEDRVAALEGELRSRAATVENNPPAGNVPLAQKAEILRARYGAQRGGARAVPPPLPIEALISVEPETSSASTPLPLSTSSPRPVAHLPYATPVPRPPAMNEGTLEQTIGLKWAGWIGALVVVIGAGLGIKYAYDQNWFGRLPPALRLMMMSLAGFGLLGAGEWVHRRINRLSAAGLFGAGVALLFVVAYAGYGFFDPPVYGRDAAFMMMAVAALIGAAVAVRGNMVSIGVLAIVGANLAPIVLSTHEPRPVPLMAYLLALQLVALALTWWGEGGKWWVLRSLSLLSTALWMTLVIPDPGTPRQPVLAFVVIYAVLYQAELIFSTLRWNSARAANAPDGRPIFGTAVTALLATAVLCLLHDRSPATQGLWTIGLAGAAAAAALLLRGRTALRALSIGLRIQAAALVMLAVPVSFSGTTVSLTWGLMAVAFASLGARLGLRVAKYAAVATWVLAAGWIGVWMSDEAGREAALGTWMIMGSFQLARWVAVAWGLVALGHAAAGVMRLVQVSASSQSCAEAPEAEEAAGPARAAPGPAGISDSLMESAALATVADTLAGLLMAGATIGGLSAVGSTISLVVYMWLMVALDRAFTQPAWLMAGGAAMVMAMCKWAVVDAIGGQAVAASAGHRPILNPMMASGGVISASLVGAYLLRRNRIMDLLRGQARGWGEGLGMIVATAVVILLTVGLAVEIDRAVDAAVAAGSVWPGAVLKWLSWTMLLAAATTALAGLNLVLEPRPSSRFNFQMVLYVIALGLAGGYMIVGTLGFRLMHQPARVTPMGNTQVLAGVFVLGAIQLLVRMLRNKAGCAMSADEDRAGIQNPNAGFARGAVGWFASILLLLWMGSMEIDRFCQVSVAGAPQLRLENVLLSIFWGVFAITSVIVGFPTRQTTLRFFGLGLFAVTLLKVALVDLGDVGTGYRILSFMGVGLLLLGTSVIYGRFSPRLLEEGAFVGKSAPRREMSSNGAAATAASAHSPPAGD